MPVVYVDSEAADLIEAAVVMLESALTARTDRADPDQVISNSLKLQSHKLKGFRSQLRSAEPPTFAQLPEPLRRKALRAASELVKAGETPAAQVHWDMLRGLVNAAGVR